MHQAVEGPGLARDATLGLGDGGRPSRLDYGVGTPGFGVWREAATHTMTTNRVPAGQYQGFR